MSLIAKEISDFCVKAYKNGAIIDVTKEDLIGQWSVFCFYPGDFTAMCSSELVDLAAHYDTLLEIGCEIYAVSTDTHHVHKAWHENTDIIESVKYAMIGDPNHMLSKEFDVLDETKGTAVSGTFIINPEAKIVAYEVSDMTIARDVTGLLRKIQAAQFVAKSKLVSMRKWQWNENNIKPILYHLQ